MFHSRQAAGLPPSLSSVRPSARRSSVLRQRAVRLLVGVAIAGSALSVSACSQYGSKLHAVAGVLTQLPLR
jgi:hypothetical protein